MENFFDQEKAIAIVYFLSENDEKNKLLITDEKLLVIRKNHKSVHALSQIASLKIEVKKYLFPLILGGIFTPFAFLSYFVNFFHPWFHLLSVLLGMLLFYIGWTGKSAFTIVFKNTYEEFYYLPSVSKNLLAFIDFVNSLLKNQPTSIHGNLMYFEVEKQNQPLFFGELVDSNSQVFPLLGYTFKQLKNKRMTINHSNIIAINPQKSGREIKFSYDLASGQMRPKLDGPILSESKEEFFTSDL